MNTKNQINQFIIYLKIKNFSNSTIKTYKNIIEHFFKLCNDFNLKNVVFFITFKQLKPCSIRTKFFALNKFAEFLKMDFNDFKKEFKLPTQNQEPRVVISPNQLKQILDSLKLNKFYDVRKYIILRILYETGLRATEFLNMKKSDIKNDLSILVIGKGYKNRKVFITKDLYEFINKNWKYEYFFVCKKGKTLSDRQFRKLIKNIGKKHLATDNLSPHSLRRSFCTNLIKAGCNLKIVQSLMGHSSITTTSKYIFFDQEEIYNEFNKYMKY